MKARRLTKKDYRLMLEQRRAAAEHARQEEEARRAEFDATLRACEVMRQELESTLAALRQKQLAPLQRAAAVLSLAWPCSALDVHAAYRRLARAKHE
jgi:hypothetical protein